jgi:hypothetical protein
VGNASKNAQIASNRKEKAPTDGSKGLFVFRRFAIIATSRCTAFKFYIEKAASVCQPNKPKKQKKQAPENLKVSFIEAH